MGKVKVWRTFGGVLALLFAACGPAAAPTPATTAPTATAVPATSTPTPTKARGLTPAATATPAPSPTPRVSGPKYGGVLRYFLPWDADANYGWDMHRRSSDWGLSHIENATLNRLFTKQSPREGSCAHPDTPDLAESYRWVNDTTLDVKLRKGVRFHNKPPANGREVTVDDVVWNFRRVVQYTIKYRPIADNVASVEAVAPDTVRFTLKKPFVLFVPSFLAGDVGNVVYAPEAASGPKQDFADPFQSMIGTGPFVFKDWKRGVKVTADRNPSYFRQGQPYVDGIELRVIPDISTRLAAFNSGQMDVLTEVPIPLALSIKETRPQIRVSGCSSLGGFGTFYLRTDIPPLNDVRVRRALSMGIDRQAIVKSLFMGQGEVIGIVPSVHGEMAVAYNDFPAEIRRYIEYRPDEARKLLAEAGVPNLRFKLETTAAFGSPHPESNEAALAMWKAIGVNVDVVWHDRASWFVTVSASKFDQMGWSRPGQSDSWRWLLDFHSRNPIVQNRSRINDPVLDDLIDRLAAKTNAQEQVQLVRDIQKRLVEQVYFIQLPNPNQFALTQPYVRDFGEQGYLGYRSTFYEQVWYDR